MKHELGLPFPTRNLPVKFDTNPAAALVWRCCHGLPVRETKFGFLSVKKEDKVTNVHNGTRVEELKP